MPSITGTPNPTLSAVVALETTKALRAGMSIQSVIATLLWQAETLQVAMPIVNAVVDSQRGTPCKG